MKIKLGIIGEEHAINILQEVIEEYDDYEVAIFIDNDETRTLNIIADHQQEVDAWLVFDQINYLRIEKWGKAQKTVYYTPYRGASFYKTLCTAIYQGFNIDELSIDTIPYYDITRGLDDMQITYNVINYLSDEHADLPLDSYVAFHRELFKKGITKAAVTKSCYVKSLLEQEGIPTFCIIPIRVTIRNILNLILSHFRIKNLQECQIAVQVFSFNLLGEKDNFYSVDDLYSREIAISQKLISYTKNISGSLKPANEGNFYIFTTRGCLEQLTNSFTSLPDLPMLHDLSKSLRACGIGIGNSAREAEYNAVIALKHACADQKGSWYVVLDDKTISGPLGSAQQIDYQYASAQLEAVSKKTSLSQATLSKICHALKIYGRDELNAQELATILQILPRSARRILTCLTEHGYAEETRSEMSEIKGRPRKIYKIKL